MTERTYPLRFFASYGLQAATVFQYQGWGVLVYFDKFMDVACGVIHSWHVARHLVEDLTY